MSIKNIYVLKKKINLTWIKDLSIRPETIKLLEVNIGEMLHNIGLGNDFWAITLQAQARKAKAGRRHLVKLKSTVKDTTHRMERQLMGLSICKACMWKGVNIQNVQRTPTSQ